MPATEDGKEAGEAQKAFLCGFTKATASITSRDTESFPQPPRPFPEILCLFSWPVVEQTIQNMQQSSSQRKVQMGPVSHCAHEIWQTR